MAADPNMCVLNTACGKLIQSTDKRGLKKREELHLKTCEICQTTLKTHNDTLAATDIPNEDPVLESRKTKNESLHKF